MICFAGDYCAVLGSVAVCLALGYWCVMYRFTHKGGKIPQTSSSMANNIAMIQNQKGLTKLQHIYKMCRSFKEGDFGKEKYGVTFEFKFPTSKPFIVTTDFELTRHFLQGENEQEKSFFMKTLNTIDRDTFNILTHYTHNEERDKARKALAPCFSTTNLQQTWPFLEAGLLEEFGKLRKLAQSGELLDGRNNLLMFMLRMLGRSAFGTEFTDDHTESTDTIDGWEYLEVQTVAASVRMKEMGWPLRRYYFWDAEVQNGERCTRRLKQITEKMLHLYEQHEGGTARSTAEGGKPLKRLSIMHALAHHAYPNVKARLADINVMTFAGHDTTGFSLCFLLMELGRHPEVRTKLQAELAAVMPKEALGGGGGLSRTEGQLRHGDQKLLSALCGLEYLNYCIKEALRLWPVAAIGSVRQLDKDMHWKGMVFPKGSTIRAHHFSMFRESWIDRPLEFLPERWAPDNPQLPALKEMLMPFSLGRRACIGQNMAMFQLRIVTAYLLHYFDFTLVGEPDFEYFLTLKPVNLYLSVKERDMAK
jgi:cytochrome P450